MNNQIIAKLQNLSTSDLLSICNKLSTAVTGYSNKKGLIDHIIHTFETYHNFVNCDMLTEKKQYECYARCLTFEDIISTYQHICNLEEKNRLQIVLIKESELSTMEWIKTFAAKFSLIYTAGEFDLEVIKTLLY